MTVNLKRYAAVLVATMIGLAILVFAVDAFLGINLQNAGMAIIPIMIAAMVEGQKHANVTRDLIPSPWKQAAVMTVIAVAVNLVVLLIVSFFDPTLIGMPAGVWAIIGGFIVIMGLVWFFANRFFLTFGAKNQWKALDRQASK